MKKLIVVTVLAVLGLSLLAFLQLRKNSSFTDTEMQDIGIAQNGLPMQEEITAARYEVEIAAEELLPTLTAETPDGDMTIRNAKRLNVSEVSELGALVGGKLLYFRQVGNPVNFRDSEDNLKRYYETEVRLLNCADDKISNIYTIHPVGEILCTAGLDNTYAYAFFSSAVTAGNAIPAAEDTDAKVNASLADSEPKSIEVSSKLENVLLRIDVRNGEISEYHLPLGDGTVGEIAPLGGKNMLIHSYIYGEDEGLDNLYVTERIDILNFKDGSFRNFYSGAYSEELGNPVDISFVSASEDKVYFSVKTTQDGMVDYGFRVYDSDMNFIYGENVSSIPENEAVTASAEMGVSNGNIYYKINCDIDDGNQKYYKYSPTTAGYMQVPFRNDSGNYEYNQMTLYSANPRNSTHFDYIFCQGNDESGASYIYLSNAVQNTYYQLEIDVPGFKYPRFINSYYPIVTDFNGDFLLLSAGSDYYDNSGYKKPFEYFYVPASEMNRALYGNTSASAE